MKLEGEQLVLDTNILIHWLRGRVAGAKLSADYGLGARRPRPIVPLVVKGESKSFALQCGWGDGRQKALDVLLSELPVADIASEAVIERYARVDHQSRRLGRRMGKNDLWIAAIASVQGAVLVTTDQDFDHLHSTFLQVEYIDAASLETSPSTEGTPT